MIEKLKQNKLLLTILIITIILILTGVTYSLYNILFTGKKSQTITVGDINFAYNEKTNGLSLTEEDILDNENGIKSDKYFDFDIKLTTTNDVSITYQIAIEEDSNNTISNDKIMLYLTDQNDNKILDKISIDNLQTDDKGYKKLYAKTINKNETHTYRLRAWVDLDKAYEIISNNGSQSLVLAGGVYKFKVNVYDTEKSGVEKLIELTSNKNDSGLYTITHNADSTLQIGTTESITEYRYRGASPKNYVTFNNETWRIIGVFKADDGNGNIENRIKLIRNESIGNKYWNTTEVSSTSSYNNWTGATLKTELNGTYLNSLTSAAQSMISDTKYYLGGKNPEWNDGYVDTPLQFYSYERKIQNTTSNEFYYGTNPNSWIGKIALMYVSDYGYASDACENKMLWSSTSSANDLRACNTTNWLYKGAYEWLLPQFANYSYAAFVVDTDGSVGYGYVSDVEFGVRPVLCLTSSVQITGGDGTSSSPYTLGL